MTFSSGRQVAALWFLLSGSALYSSQVTVVWDDNSGGETGFRIERQTGEGSFVQIGTVGANVTTFVDPTVLVGTAYAYRVAAFDAQSTSSYSNVTQITPNASNVSANTGTSGSVGGTTSGQPPSGTSSTTNTQSAPATSRLMNLSVRAVPGPGDRALLVGFVVADASKSMLVRAVGPGLSTYTTASVFQDPSLTLMSGGTVVANNDNWESSDALKAHFARLGAFPLPDASKDAVVLTTLSAKSYSANVTGSGSGLALAEIYDADSAAQPAGRLVNVSARAAAGPGDGVLIVGFVITGNAPLRVLVRAIGPSLVARGVNNALMNPQLDVYHGSTLVQHNDDWSGTNELAAAFASAGAFPIADRNSKDAALIATLSPGAYTAIVSGVSGTSGIALAEVYELR